MRRIAITVAALAFGGAACAQDKACSKADAANAERSIERVVGWEPLHKAWQDHRHCDKDAVAESYTDAVLRLLVQWKDVETLARVAQKDAGFRQFIVARLKRPEAKDDLDAVYSRAKASCPKGLDAFCADLAEAAKPGK